MENIEANLSTDSDDEFKITVHSDFEIPEQLSVDNLLIERMKNPIIPRSHSLEKCIPNLEENPNTPKKSPSKISSLLEVSELSTRDGCIFNYPKNEFPTFILDALKINEEEINQIFSKFNKPIPKYLIRSLQTFPGQIPPSTDLFYSYAHYIVSNNVLDAKMTLFNYSQLFPANSIEYVTWRSLFVYSIKHSLNGIFSLFSVCNFFLFSFKSQEESDSARIEIILLFFALICTTAVVEHRQFPAILHQMRSCLVDADFDKSQVSFVVKVMCDTFSHIPIEMTSLVASFFPIDGVGSLIVHNFSIKIALQCFGLHFDDSDQVLSIENLSKELFRIHSLCESTDEMQLIKASAVLSLSERALVCALHFKKVPNEVFVKMIRALRFGMKGTDLAVMTRLKEQIHFTRAQFEDLSQSDFSQWRPSNLFFDTNDI